MPRRCACLSFGPPSFTPILEARKDAGDQLRMPRAASWRRHSALRQLGRYAAQRQALLFQITRIGASSTARAVASALYRNARSAPVAPSRTPRCFAAASAALVLAEIARASSCATAA